MWTGLLSDKDAKQASPHDSLPDTFCFHSRRIENAPSSFSLCLLFVALVALVALVANVAGVLIYVKLSKLVFLTMSKAQIRIPFLAISGLGN